MANLPDPTVAGEQLSELLIRWQEDRRQGRNPTAAELCADCPEFTGELQRQMKAVSSMEGMLGLEGNAVLSTPLASSGTHDSPSRATGWVEAPPGGVTVPGYDLLAVANRGGMGIVYKARQRALNRLVALKMIQGGRHVRAEQRSRFRNEVETLARMQHPNIVQIYDVGETDGQPYLAMEWVEGGSLAEKLNGTPLPPQQAAHLAETLSRAVHAAHQRGIIHRDLKPGNVLLGTDGTPKISDFGLAKDQDTTDGFTQSQAILGTPSYMAPEQAQAKSKEAGPAVDVYSLGAVLYEMLAGRPPFHGETILDTLEQVRHQDPVPPRRLQPGGPRDLETICLKCLEKDPGQRYSSAAELAEDLRRFLAGEPVRARAAAPWEPGIKWVMRKPASAGLVAVGIAAGLCLLAGVFWVRAERQTQQEEHLKEQERQRERDRRDVAQQADIQAVVIKAREIVSQDAQAAINAKMSASQDPAPGAALYNLAAAYAVTSANIRRDNKLTTFACAQFSEKYAASAVELLQKAKEQGFFTFQGNLERLRENTHFDPIRDRPDFQKFLVSLEKQETRREE